MRERWFIPARWTPDAGRVWTGPSSALLHIVDDQQRYQERVLVRETDKLGYTIARNPVHVHDFQATILHLLGVDHERLTFRHQGRRYRLTDVFGNVVHDLLA